MANSDARGRHGSIREELAAVVKKSPGRPGAFKKLTITKESRDQGALDAPILSQSTNHARRGSPITLKLDTTARDNQSTQDNEKYNRSDYRPPIIFGAPWVGPPTVVARFTSAFKVSIYHHKANVSGFAEFRVSPARTTTKAPLPRGARGGTIQQAFMRTAGFIAIPADVRRGGLGLASPRTVPMTIFKRRSLRLVRR